MSHPFKNKVEFINYWAKNLKYGDVIEYDKWDDSTPRTVYAIQCNHKDVWFATDRNNTPPYTLTIPWDDILNIYTKETNPEYYL